MAHGWLFKIVSSAVLAAGVLLPPPAAVLGETAGWTRQFGTPGSDRAEGVALDPRGDVYLAGWTMGVLPGQSSAGTVDAFVRKYDPDGGEIWTRQFGSWERDFARALATDAAGAVYVVGETYGVLPGQASAGGFDAFVRKYDPDGQEVWTRQFGGGGGETAWGVAVDDTGATYLVGSTGGALPGQTTAGLFDAFVRKYDPDGQELWTRQFGTPHFDGARGVAFDPIGNLLVVGNTEGDLPGQASAGGIDAFIRRYDPDGNELWTHQFGALADDYGVAVAVDRAGKASVAGTTDGMFPDAAAGSSDVFLSGYTRAGEPGWARQFGTRLVDDGFGIALDGGGNAYVTGTTDGTLPGQTSAGKGDVFVRRYDPFGEAVWTLQFGSPDWDSAAGIAVDRNGALYVTGETFAALPGQVSSGQRDAFLVKITR
jgi:beta-propeller repeat-containing protein